MGSPLGGELVVFFQLVSQLSGDIYGLSVDTSPLGIGSKSFIFGQFFRY